MAHQELLVNGSQQLFSTPVPAASGCPPRSRRLRAVLAPRSAGQLPQGAAARGGDGGRGAPGFASRRRGRPRCRSRGRWWRLDRVQDLLRRCSVRAVARRAGAAGGEPAQLPSPPVATHPPRGPVRSSAWYLPGANRSPIAPSRPSRRGVDRPGGPFRSSSGVAQRSFPISAFQASRRASGPWVPDAATPTPRSVPARPLARAGPLALTPAQKIGKGNSRGQGIPEIGPARSPQKNRGLRDPGGWDPSAHQAKNWREEWDPLGLGKLEKSGRAAPGQDPRLLPEEGGQDVQGLRVVAAAGPRRRSSAVVHRVSR